MKNQLIKILVLVVAFVSIESYASNDQKQISGKQAQQLFSALEGAGVQAVFEYNLRFIRVGNVVGEISLIETGFADPESDAQLAYAFSLQDVLRKKDYKVYSSSKAQRLVKMLLRLGAEKYAQVSQGVKLFTVNEIFCTASIDRHSNEEAVTCEINFN